MRKFSIAKTFDIIDCEGKDKLKSNSAPRLKESGVEALGIIIDADEDLCSRWEPIRNFLKGQRFSVPEELPKDGLVIHNEYGVKVGVWSMPNNNLNGMLEDFMISLVPKDDDLMPIVDATLEDIEKKGLHK